jgi:ABC-type bacteriocin/lantibiotic exporter with double-glycine peptidase domain
LLCKKTFENLSKVNYPFIAHISDSNSFYILVTNIDEKKEEITYYQSNKKRGKQSFTSFDKKWSHNVFYIIPNDNSKEEKYYRNRFIELFLSFRCPLLILLLILAIGCFFKYL